MIGDLSGKTDRSLMSAIPTATCITFTEDPSATARFLQEKQREGIDKGSIVAGPLFVNVRENNYALRSNSSALRLGFMPIDQKHVMRFWHLFTLLVLLVMVSCAGFFNELQAQSRQSSSKLNVLFITVDDLRPQLGCYGDPVIKTPNIDRLAKRSLVFERAYCQQALCSPSRTSLLTGLRPDTTRVYDIGTHFRRTIPNAVTLPEHFKKHGYHTRGLGKIFHLFAEDPSMLVNLDDPQSWSVPLWVPSRPTYGPEGQSIRTHLYEEARKNNADFTKQKNIPKGLLWESANVPDQALPDGETADHAVKVLGEMKGKPFFLAVGFLQPHTPLVAPTKYWELYPESQIKLAKNSYPPANAPSYALHNSNDVRGYMSMPKVGPFSEAHARKIIHAYYASVSYVDAQVGRILDELDRLGLRDKTVVVLLGDHGWQLGEHGMWEKHSNFETSVRAPLLVSLPGQRNAGKKTNALVEFVDVYPTLVEACGLPNAGGLEGTSFALLFKNPNRQWKKAAFSQYPRTPKIMGRSMRTDRYRYTEWVDEAKGTLAVELYDHQSDPDENINISLRPDNKELITNLSNSLRKGWKAALPLMIKPAKAE